MVIIRTDCFKKQLREIVFYIVRDKKEASKNFRYELNTTIDNLVNSPYKYRQSIYYENKNIRDMTFHGYSIIYRIDKQKNSIEILEIFNRNLLKLINKN